MQSQYAIDSVDVTVVAAEIMKQHGRMPDYLHLPLHVATMLFDLAGILSGGKRFQVKSVEAQIAQLLYWKCSQRQFCRNFIRCYESSFLLIVLQEEQT